MADCAPHRTRALQVLWDVASGTAICGSPTHHNFTLCVKFFHARNDKLITGGTNNLHVWEYDQPNNKLRPQEAQLGHLQRAFKSITVDSRDQYAYCGTSSGDVLQVRWDVQQPERLPVWAGGHSWAALAHCRPPRVGHEWSAAAEWLRSGGEAMCGWDAQGSASPAHHSAPLRP